MAEDSYIKTLEKVDIAVDGVTYNLVAASYKGAPFFVESYSHGGGGRSIATKKIPFSSDYVNEDVGGNVPSHSMEIFLVGDDCDVQKQNLLKACAKEGPGEVVHPWIGRFAARCTSLSFSSSRQELGYIKGSISFVQESTLPEKSVTTSLKGVTKNSAASFVDSAKAKFASALKTAKKAKKFVDNVAASTEDALDAVENGRKGLREVSAFVNELGKIKANSEVLLATPEDFAARIADIVSSASSVFGIDTDARDDTDEFYAIATSVGSTLIELFVRKIAAAMLASSLVDAEFSSVDEAAGYQDRITDLYDSMLEDTDDIDEYMALEGLRSSALSYLRDAMASMAVVLEKENRGSTNILSFAFDTYGNLDKVDDIMARNFFTQGLFVLPGKVKVLSR